jgi:hypothetical protein
MQNRVFNSSDEIEEAITKVWDGLFVDELQSMFHNWMSRLARVIENGERMSLNKYEMVSWHVMNLRFGRGTTGTVFTLYILIQSQCLSRNGPRRTLYFPSRRLIL